MGKKNNIIEINGQRYDAHTGTPIGQASHTPIVKPIVVHHADVPKTIHHGHSASRQPAKKLSRHAPQRSTTLMRRAVKKPPASLKHHIKAQGNTSALVEQPAVPVVPKLSFGKPNPKRLQHASHIKKSRLITHFNFNISQPAYTVAVAVAQPSPAPVQSTAPPKRRPAPDAADIFERAVQQATSHLEPAPKKPKKHRLHFARRHAKHARV